MKVLLPEELNKKESDSKEKQIHTLIEELNCEIKCSVNLSEIGHQIFEDPAISEQFVEYRKAFEKHQNIEFQDSFTVDKSGLSTPKSIRRIRLDDNAEIHLLKTGSFIERGFDSTSNLYYYKLLFSKEK